jgi:hypothetical protein
MRIYAALATLLMTACCVAPPKPEPAPPPTPAPPPPAPAPTALPQSEDWRDWPLTPGDWTYARTPTGSIARYGRPGFAPDLSVQCDAGRIALLRAAPAPAGTGRIDIRTTSRSAGFAVTPGADGQSWQASMAAREPMLDAIVYSRGRFMVSMPGMPNLIAPSWPEIARVVEDCRV